MRAAILENVNVLPEIQEVGLTDLKFGQVLVKNIVSGICGSQLQEIKGNKGNEKFMPHLIGHEGYGIVQNVGLGVCTVQVGDHVVMHWRPGQGIESDFPNYVFNGKTISSGKVTTLSEYSIVSENRITKVPDSINPEFAALLGCGLSTALGVVENEAKVQVGESVLIIGAGGVGLNLVQATIFSGGIPSVLDVNKNKETLVNSMGANFYLIFDKKWDVIIDTTGNVNVINKAFQNLNGGGRLILVGQPNPSDSLILDNPLSFFDGNGKMIKASQGGGFNPHLDIERYLKKFIFFNMNVITHRFDLNNISEAFNLLQSGTAGRIMIRIDNG